MAIEAIGNESQPYLRTNTEVSPNISLTPKVAEVEKASVEAPRTVQSQFKQPQQSKPWEEDERKEASQESIKKAVKQINSKMDDAVAVFGIHEKTKSVTIKIVDKKTHETIKEYPPEKTLDMIAKVWELAGILVDTKR
ncbi:hypothetical protein FACS1894111_05110 [Clostridia bacterium]|nr:hypothetical protein FACS1894111_05110 [Clostridia bacterium]